MLTATTPPKNR